MPTTKYQVPIFFFFAILTSNYCGNQEEMQGFIHQVQKPLGCPRRFRMAVQSAIAVGDALANNPFVESQGSRELTYC